MRASWRGPPARPFPVMSVAEENARAGDASWWPAKHATEGSIEGYASWPSVLPGGRLELHVSTLPAARYAVTVHRLGWYGGSGGRMVNRHPAVGGSDGFPRTRPVADGLQVPSARWPVTDSISVGSDWPSGQYVAWLTLLDGASAGEASSVPFVVRERPDRRAPALVQMPVTTAAAYNHWGGRSLYSSNSIGGEAAIAVSLDRPIPPWTEANINARWPFVWDVQLIRFLEREGYDVAYTTDLDVHREPWSLVGRRLLLTSGHDEYWTREMRDAWESARDAGTNLACMGANSAYWQCRLEDGERTMVQYRTHGADPEGDPSRATVRFRDLRPARPEMELFGVQYDGGVKRPSEPPRSYVVHDGEDRWLPKLSTGDELPDLVGYEWDAPGAGLPGVSVLLRHDDPGLSDAACVRYETPTATAFAAGSLQFSWALDDWSHPGHADARIQATARAMLDELLAR